MLKIGDKAPDFTLAATNGKNVSLKNLKGKKVILYFYPKDDTPGCTKEACGFRDELNKFHKKNVVILGVSRDSMASHEKFKSKYDLPFLLLSDPDSKTCEAYEVIVEKNMYGKKSMGVNRSTFLIDENGKIAQIWRNVKVDGHIEEILEKII